MSTVYDTHIRELANFFSDHCSNNAFYFRDKGGKWNPVAFSYPENGSLVKAYSLSSNLEGFRFYNPILADGDQLIRKDYIDGMATSGTLVKPLAARGKVVNTIHGAIYSNQKYGETKTAPIPNLTQETEESQFPRTYFGIDDSALYTLVGSKDDETKTFTFTGTDATTGATYSVGDWISNIRIDVTTETGSTGETKNRDFIRVTFLPFQSLEALEQDLDLTTDCGSCNFCGCLATWSTSLLGYFPTSLGLRLDGVHMLNVIHVLKTETGIINKNYLTNFDARFVRSNRVFVSKYTTLDEDDTSHDPEMVPDDSVEVLDGTFVKSEWFNRFKVSSTKHETVISKHGTIFIFYEKNNNISVAMSKDNGDTWFDFDGIIRLKFGERAAYPKVIMNKINDEVFLFYVFNNSYLCCKRINLSWFIEEDAFIDYVPVVDFLSGTINTSTFVDEYENLGLEQFSIHGKRIRKEVSQIVMGNFLNKNNFDLLEEIDISSNRKARGLSYRFETIALKENYYKEYNEDISKITYDAFLDKNGAIYLWYSLNENAAVFIDKNSCENPEDCSIDKGCNPLSYSPVDATNLDFNLFQVRKSNRSLLSWPKVFSNIDLFDEIFPCEEETEEASVHKFCRQGNSSGTWYKMEFSVLYDAHTDHFYILCIKSNGSLWIRRWRLDTVRRLENFTPDPCFDKSCSTNVKNQSSTNFLYRNYLQLNGELNDLNPVTLVDQEIGTVDSRVTPAMFLTSKGHLKLYYTRNSQLISISTSSDPIIRYVT